MRLRPGLCALVAMLFASTLLAQRITGTIRGTISDPSGALVPAASVTVRQVETGLTRTTSSDHTGNYLLLELPVGHYSLEITAKGFRKYLRDGISLNVNETAVIPVRLTLGTETEQIQVMGDAQLIQSTVSSLGDVVEEHARPSPGWTGTSHSSACCSRESSPSLPGCRRLGEVCATARLTP